VSEIFLPKNYQNLIIGFQVIVENVEMFFETQCRMVTTEYYKFLCCGCPFIKLSGLKLLNQFVKWYKTVFKIAGESIYIYCRPSKRPNFKEY